MTLRGLVLALVLAVFALSPAAEGLVCGADDVAVAEAGWSAESRADAPADHGSDKSACPHGGHCHQMSMADLRADASLPVRHIQTAPVAMALVLLPASRTLESLERPPRA